MRTTYDLEMLREVGVCSGIENYSPPPRRALGRAARRTRCSTTSRTTSSSSSTSRHVDRPAAPRPVRGRPVPQGHAGRARVPAAVGDGQPAAAVRGVHRAGQPGRLHDRPRPAPYELEVSTQVVEQIVRPTGLMDPEVVVRPTKGQIDDLVAEIRAREEADQRVLVTTLTKKMSEDLTDYLLELGHPGAVPPLRDRHARAGRDPPGPAARRVRRAGRHQPAAGGPRPARGVARGHPRRRQGGLPPLRDRAHPDDRAGGPERRRPGRDVRRPDDRLDAARDLARPSGAGASCSSTTTRSTASTRRRSARRSPTSWR